MGPQCVLLRKLCWFTRQKFELRFYSATLNKALYCCLQSKTYNILYEKLVWKLKNNYMISCLIKFWANEVEMYKVPTRLSYWKCSFPLNPHVRMLDGPSYYTIRKESYTPIFLSENLFSFELFPLSRYYFVIWESCAAYIT